ncbi:TPA: hypothetical protein UM516_004243 [Stenotrophomonas maltophilia]|nr:hypothetical protein [Stenotrophomonas maltophilia]HEL4237897.1 hypothetical protein [Stenotrophomonas maltophilia]
MWWLLLVSLLSAFLLHRYRELVLGNAVPADIVVFVTWVALLLAPLFNEVSLLGVTLKQKIDELKEHVADQITEIKSEVRSAVDVRATFSPHFNIPAPASDAQLPEIERRIKLAVSDALEEHGIRQPPPPAQIPISNDVALLFATRYNLEKELRRISETRQLLVESRRPIPLHHLTRALTQADLLEPQMASAIREIYSVCSPAIHGEEVTPAQVAFVQGVGPELIAALRAIT